MEAKEIESLTNGDINKGSSKSNVIEKNSELVAAPAAGFTPDQQIQKITPPAIRVFGK